MLDAPGQRPAARQQTDDEEDRSERPEGTPGKHGYLQSEKRTTA